MTIIARPDSTMTKDADISNIECATGEQNYSATLDKSLRVFFWNAFKICANNPTQAISFFRTMQNQIKAVTTREKYEKQGIRVPPIMIFSVTGRCNLRCKGCYHWALRSQQNNDLSDEKLRSIITQSSELGISFMVLAGGEPLIRPGIMDITAEYPNIQFLVFTNGTMINNETIFKMEKQRNVVPVISLEGNQTETDQRRGNGIYNTLEKTFSGLSKKNIFWGTSLTVTRMNLSTICENDFIKDLYHKGCRLFFFVEYTPTSEETVEMAVTDDQRFNLNNQVRSFRDKYSALFVSVPGDEAEFGGCLAAGRGFIHVSAQGSVEPCPFVPYSDANLKNIPLAEALKSDFLRKIRESSHELEEGPGGCALWNKREWLTSLLQK